MAKPFAKSLVKFPLPGGIPIAGAGTGRDDSAKNVIGWLSDHCLPWKGGSPEGRMVKAIRRLHSQRALEDWSDWELRHAISSAKRNLQPNSTRRQWEEGLVLVYAIVDETIRRRLGAWRFFSQPPTSNSSNLRLRAALEDSDSTNLDADQRQIAAALSQVNGAGDGHIDSGQLLPASFYRALNGMDRDGLYRFLPTDEQLLAGLHLLGRNVVEMEAGEGKTVAIAFAAVAQAVMGRRVHVHTANDYLAERDCQLLTPVYRALGLSTAAVVESLDGFERRAAYSNHIVYGTLREFGFDYLRDNLALRTVDQVQPSVEAAIIDEADLALIDDADTPLIIAGEPDARPFPWAAVNRAVADMVSQQNALADSFARQLAQGLHPSDRGQTLCLGLLANPRHPELRHIAREEPKSYRRGMAALHPEGGDVPDEELTTSLFYLVDDRERMVTLTERGVSYLESRLGSLSFAAAGRTSGREVGYAPSRKEERQLRLASQAFQSLRAHVLLERNVDYLVVDDTIILLDRHTGRNKPDSTYRNGLQPALEAKERLTVRPEYEVAAQSSVAGIVSRYCHVAGITGTALPATNEFRLRYSLDTVRIPPARSTRRTNLPARIYASEADKMAALVEEVAHCRLTGRPMLVGVQTVGKSLQVSEALAAAGIDHQALNAIRSDEEAEIIRRAGELGAVTVATNMAGRGTDIILSPGINGQCLQRWSRLLLDSVAKGKGPIWVRCNSGEEADLLASTLRDCGELKVNRRSLESYPALVVTGSDDAPPVDVEGSPGSILEFGLGLHVINSEFIRFPRVALQLQGRSGRQGLFGSTVSLLSWEDLYLTTPGRKAPPMEGCQKSAGISPAYHEGPDVERYLKHRQAEAEGEAARQRSLAYDYAAVCDAHTRAYYSRRQDLLESGGSSSSWRAIFHRRAAQLVNQNFPNNDTFDYASRLQELVGEAARIYHVDVRGLEGQPLDALPSLVAEEMLSRLEMLQSSATPKKFRNWTRSVLLESGDEAWRQHLVALQSAALGSLTGEHGHKSAVADYVIHCTELWERFRENVEEAFCVRLLNHPAGISECALPKSATDSTLENELAYLMAA